MEEKKRDPLPGEPGHWRYEKEKKIGANKATTIETMKKKEVVPDKIQDIIYSKTAIKDMKREQQEEILTARGIKFNNKDKELNLISKILNSNPKK